MVKTFCYRKWIWGSCSSFSSLKDACQKGIVSYSNSYSDIFSKCNASNYKHTGCLKNKCNG
jgi:hypothetical protein